MRDAGYDTIAVTCMGWERDPVTKKLFANPKTWPHGYVRQKTLPPMNLRTLMWPPYRGVRAMVDYLRVGRTLPLPPCQH